MNWNWNWIRISCLLTICLGFSYSLKAQMSDSINYRFSFSSSGSFNETKTSSSNLFDNSIGFDIEKKRIELNTLATWLYGNVDKKLSNNDWNALVNLNLYTNYRPVYFWGLVNYNSSFSLGVNQQYQLGSGIAMKFFQDKDFSFSISDGLIYELSDINTAEGDTLKYNTWRNSLRLKVKYKYKDFASISTTFFHQPSLKYKNDYILISSTTAKFKIWKSLSLTTAAHYNKVSRTEKENFNFTYGLSFEKYF